MKIFLSTLAVGSFGILLFCGAPANAQVLNGSFENGNFTGTNPGGNPNTTQLLAGATNMTGWTVVNELTWHQAGNIYGISASDGSRSLDLTGFHDSQPEGGVQQSLTLVPSDSYTLGLDVGYNTSYPTAPDGVTATIAGFSQTFNNAGTGPGLTVGTTLWKTFTFTFTPTSANNTLLLQGSAASSGPYIGLDNVTLVDNSSPTPTPEPGACAFLGSLALAGAARLRRKRGR